MNHQTPSTNPAASASAATIRRLGLRQGARALVIVADDVGMCHASLGAFDDLLTRGTVSAGSAMVPGPWFPALALQLRGRVEIGIGLHVTLTSEWEGYRWAPRSTREAASGLLDGDGYFPRTQAVVWAHADPTAAETEAEAQLDAAVAAGLTVTHLDMHMGCMAHPRLLPAFVDLALRRRLVLRETVPLAEPGGDDAWREVTVRELSRVAAQGWPLFDHAVTLPLEAGEVSLDSVLRTLDSLPQGLSLLVIHPAHDTPELRAMAPDWEARVAHYELFMHEAVRERLHAGDLALTSFAQLRALIPPEAAP